MSLIKSILAILFIALSGQAQTNTLSIGQMWPLGMVLSFTNVGGGGGSSVITNFYDSFSSVSSVIDGRTPDIGNAWHSSAGGNIYVTNGYALLLNDKSAYTQIAFTNKVYYLTCQFYSADTPWIEIGFSANGDSAPYAKSGPWLTLKPTTASVLWNWTAHEVVLTNALPYVTNTLWVKFDNTSLSTKVVTVAINNATNAPITITDLDTQPNEISIGSYGGSGRLWPITITSE